MKFRTSNGDTVDVLEGYEEQAIAKGWTAAEGPPPNAGRAAKLINLSRREGQMNAKLAGIPAGDPRRASIESDLARVQMEKRGLISNGAPGFGQGDLEQAGAVPAEPMPNVGEMALGAIPAAGGVVGGLIGGGTGMVGSMPVGGIGGWPGAMAGAAIGGAGGEAVRQLIARQLGMDAPASPQDAAMSIAAQGALNGVAEGSGTLARGAARTIGRSLMGDALRSSATAAKPGIVRGTKSAVDVMERERLPVGKLPWEKESGFQRANKAVGESVAKTEAALSTSPTKLTVRDVVNEASSDLRKIKLRAANARQIDEVNQFVREAAQFGDTPGPRGGTVPRRLSLNELNDRKRTWQNMASQTYKTTERTGSTQAQSATLSSFQQDAAKALAAAANRLMQREVPEVAVQNQTSAELGTLRRAILEAEARPQTWNPLAHGSAVTNASFVLSNPAVTSRAGLLLTHPYLLRLLQHASPVGTRFVPMLSLDQPQ